jgi:hypothetical protein
MAHAIFLTGCEQVLENDVKHSNGSLMHGERPSQEGVKSLLKSGSFSLDLIFSRLEGELKKSKDTGTELRNLTMVLDEIQDTLGGSLVCLRVFWVL